MRIFKKIKFTTHNIWHTKIVKSQYPMLSTISRYKLQKDGAIGIVYMLHHIQEKEKNRIPANEDLKISPSFLEKIILDYKKLKFDFISLDELSNIITKDLKIHNPFITFTIDDGYLDNYINALPIFERYNIPFSIFIATDFIDQKAILWWDTLEDLIIHNNVIKTEKCIYHCETFQQKWDTFRILREQILQFDQKRLEDSLNQMFSIYDIDWLKPIREKSMNWTQIKQLSQHPLCTIGGHTASHPALNNLSEEDFRKEVRLGLERIESITKQKVQHFAYPYGSLNEIGEREYQLIKEFNFKTAFTSYGGCITEKNKTNTNHLPRVYLKE